MNRRDLKTCLKYKFPAVFNLFYTLKYLFSPKGYCPFCGKTVPLTEGGKPFPRRHAKCVFCESLERHRFLFYVYKVAIFSRLERTKVLYFAPEKAFYDLFKKEDNFECVFGDIAPECYGDISECVKIDALNIPYPEGTFDIIIANHLVEHIDEARFMAELNRVLKLDGKVFLSTPIYEDMPKTFENPDYNTPKSRKKYYGHSEHLRKYGADITRRFSEYFVVSQIHSWDLPPFGDAVNSNCLILTKKR